MPKRFFVCLDLLSLQLTDMDCLRLAISPASPAQLRGLGTGKPSLARQALFRQHYAYDTPVMPLFGIVIDRGPKVFEVSTRPAVAAPRFRVRSTTRAIHLRQHLAAPPFVKARNPFVELRFVSLTFASGPRNKSKGRRRCRYLRYL